MPVDGRVAVVAVDNEIMSLRLAGDGFADGGVQTLVTAVAQGAPQIGIIVLTKTHIELARAGDARLQLSQNYASAG